MGSVFVLMAVLLLSIVGAVTSASTQQCHGEDEAALLAVNSGLGSPYHFASWTPDIWCCDWYNVDCDNSTGRVVGLTLYQDANLTGAIPDVIANLTHLESLDLHHLPGLTGGIPESLALLANLTELTISYTGVSGPVPSFLSELTALTTLDLSYNSLTGAIPASLADLPALTDIDLSRNRLSGPVPPLLFSKAPPEEACSLSASHNNLSGGIPAEFAAVRFAQVDLSRNSLSGDPSALFGRIKPLEHLDLSRNAFRFSLTGVELPEKVNHVDLSHNGIRGRIPAQVANLSSLQTFDVSYNRLCGQVPRTLARFNATSFQHNKCLCGAPLAACPR